MANALFTHLDQVHATGPCQERIRKNLGLDAEDVVRWCKQQIENPESLTRTEQHWNVRGDGFVITIDAQSYEIVTARREKSKKGSDLRDVSILKKLDDLAELKARLIAVFDTKTHRNVSKYSMLLGDHVLALASMPKEGEVALCFTVNERWREGDAKFQEARDVAFLMHELARPETDPVRAAALRTLGQLAATPHVKRHALIASDYAVKVVNLLHPGNMEEVRKERELQIRLMESV